MFSKLISHSKTACDPSRNICAFAGEGGVEMYSFSFNDASFLPPIVPKFFRYFWASNITNANIDPRELIQINDVIIIQLTNFLLTSETTKLGISRWNFLDLGTPGNLTSYSSVISAPSNSKKEQRINSML